MKKILSLFLALAMLLSLCACGVNNTQEQTQTQADSKLEKTFTVTVVHGDGSEKTFTAQLPEDNHFDIKWSLSDGVRTYEKSYENYTETFGDYTVTTDDRVMKLKVAAKYDLVGTVLTIKAFCADGSIGEIQVEVIG